MSDNKAPSDDGSTFITLSKPVKAFGDEISELKLRRPTGKDYRAIKSTHPFGMVLELTGALADVPPSTIDQLDADDIRKVTEYVGPFLS
jgi:hypothetical protein